MTSYNYITIDYVYIIYIVIILSCSDTMSWVGKRYAPSLHLYNATSTCSSSCSHLTTAPCRPAKWTWPKPPGETCPQRSFFTMGGSFLDVSCSLTLNKHKKRIIEALGCSVNKFADVSWLPSGKLTVCSWKWPSWNSWFNQQTWWIFP